MVSPLAQAQLESFWANWRGELTALGIDSKTAGQLVGRALKGHSLTEAGKLLGRLRNQNPPSGQEFRWLNQMIRETHNG